MRTPAIREDEEARLSALQEFDPVADAGDPRLDEIVERARHLFGVPMAIVSLVERERQLFAARAGIDGCETAREVSFCAHALGQDEILVVPDARLDPRFAGNPLVTGEPFVRFYAGVPLRTGSGHDVGTLCIVDRVPRSGLSARERRNLRDLARLALGRLELRRLDAAGRVGQRCFRNFAATSADAVFCADQDGRITFWNDAATMLFGWSAEEALGAGIDLILPGHLFVAGGDTPGGLTGTALELDARAKDGRMFSVELSLVTWNEGARPSFGAVLRDRGERRRIEDTLAHASQASHSVASRDQPNRVEPLEDELRQALGREEFVLLYQPQVSLPDRQLIGAEALIHWRHPERGLLTADAFAPALVRSPIARKIGTWMIEAACVQAAQWRRSAPDLRVAVAPFEAQLHDGDLHDRIIALLRRTGLPAQALELEVQEDALLRDGPPLQALRRLHAAGVVLTLDDFGAGYAALNVLKAGPLDRLKIGAGFVGNILTNDKDAVIVGAVAMLGRGLGLEVIADGVETAGQRDALHASGCGGAQGPLFGGPMAAEDFARLLDRADRRAVAA